jgi:hypothetical protein
MLLIGVAIGVAVGWSLGQSRSQAVQSEYTRVKVLTDDSATVTFGEKPNTETYYFYYKSMGHYDGDGIWRTNYDPQQPIEIDIVSSKLRYVLPPTEGSRYNVAGVEVVVSEVHDDYVVLLVKPL